MSEPLVPRREARHLLPFASVVLTADLVPLDGSALSTDAARGDVLQANVWDISRSGACLCFSEAPRQPLLNHHFALQLQQPSSSQPVHGRCRVIWIQAMHGVLFVGVELLDPLDLSAPFFQALIQPAALSDAG